MSFGEPSELDEAYSDHPDVIVKNNPRRGDAQLRVNLAAEDGESAGFPLAPAREAGFEATGVAASFTDLGDGAHVTTVVLERRGDA